MELLMTFVVWAAIMAVTFLLSWMVGHVVSMVLGDAVHAVLLIGFNGWVGYGFLKLTGWDPRGMQVKDAYYAWLIYYFVVPPVLLGLSWPLLARAWQGKLSFRRKRGGLA